MARAARTVEQPSAARHAALSGRSAGGEGVSIAVLGPAERVSLRAPAASLAALSKALGVALPDRPKSSALAKGGLLPAARARAGSRAALWLGPDEWLLLDESGSSLVADCAKAKALSSTVDISHRNVAIAVAGPAAEATLSAGCPQDLSAAAFPVGACSRTILGKVEIVLWRTGTDTFRVECWRSFADYVFGFLSEAARDAAA